MLKAIDQTSTPFSPHSSLVTFPPQADAEAPLMALQPHKRTMPFLRGIAHNPANSQTDPYGKAEKSKRAVVPLHYLQLLLRSRKIKISAFSPSCCWVLQDIEPHEPERGRLESRRKTALDPYGLT